MKLTLLLGAAACGGALLLPATRVSTRQMRAVGLAPIRSRVALMANGASAEDTPVIEGMLEERDELRRSRDYDGADAIREELRTRFKVIIDDREKMWWVDDGSGARTGRGADRAQRGDRGAREQFGYERTGNMGQADTSAIEALLVKRDELRRLRDYDGADTVRDELRFDYNVIVDDREKSWWVDDGQGDPQPGVKARGYEKDGGGASANSETNSQIETLLEERDELRRSRDFTAADAIRDQLRDEFKVIIDDRQKTWWVDDGSSGAGGSGSRREGGERAAGRRGSRDKDFGPAGHDYTRAEDDEAVLGEAERGDIDELLRRRLEAKLGREFEEADALLEELIAMGVQVNDGRKAWRADGGSFDVRPYRRVGGTLREGIDEEVVLSLIAQRTQAKKEREYQLADSLQAELTGMGVTIDDLRRTWSSDEAAGYVRVGPPSDSIQDEVVAERLQARAAAKRARDYSKADEIQAEVRAMGIELDNREMTWRYV